MLVFRFIRCHRFVDHSQRVTDANLATAEAQAIAWCGPFNAGDRVDVWHIEATGKGTFMRSIHSPSYRNHTAEKPAPIAELREVRAAISESFLESDEPC